SPAHLPRWKLLVERPELATDALSASRPTGPTGRSGRPRQARMARPGPGLVGVTSWIGRPRTPTSSRRGTGARPRMEHGAVHRFAEVDLPHWRAASCGHSDHRDLRPRTARLLRPPPHPPPPTPTPPP